MMNTLFAPNGLEIVGVRLKDGGTSTFEFTYHAATTTCQYLLPSNRQSEVTEPMTLVDANGHDWNSREVEYYTLFEHPKRRQ